MEISKTLIYIITPVLGVLISTMTYIIYNLLNKVNKMEKIVGGYIEYLDKISRVIEITDAKVKEVDIKGSFESDDEIGFFFKTIKDLQEILNNFNLRKL